MFMSVQPFSSAGAMSEHVVFRPFSKCMSANCSTLNFPSWYFIVAAGGSTPAAAAAAAEAPRRAHRSITSSACPALSPSVASGWFRLGGAGLWLPARGGEALDMQRDVAL